MLDGREHGGIITADGRQVPEARAVYTRILTAANSCRDMMRHLRIAQWTERRFAILPAILLGASGTRAIATLRSAPVTRQLVSEPDAI